MAQMLRGSRWADVEVDEECEIHGCALAERRWLGMVGSSFETREDITQGIRIEVQLVTEGLL